MFVCIYVCMDVCMYVFNVLGGNAMRYGVMPCDAMQCDVCNACMHVRTYACMYACMRVCM